MCVTKLLLEGTVWVCLGQDVMMLSELELDAAEEKILFNKELATLIYSTPF